MSSSRVATILFTIALSCPFCSSQKETYPFDEVEKTCAKIIATSPQPPAENLSAFKPGCDSSAFYFGIGRPINFEAARTCAYVERSQPNDSVSDLFRGPGILSMIYANGQGVHRDLELARRFICENGWSAAAESSYRLELIDQMATARNPPKFDLCDTATSGNSDGWCTSIEARKRDFQRKIKIEQFRSTLPPAAHQTFRELEKAEAHFEDLRTRNEVDLTGTSRAAFALEEETMLRDQFLSNLQMLRKPAPGAQLNLGSTNQALNSIYAKVQKSLPLTQPEDALNGTVTFSGVRETERAWIHLRDAWASFVKTAYTGYRVNNVIASITTQRTQQLKELL